MPLNNITVDPAITIQYVIDVCWLTVAGKVERGKRGLCPAVAQHRLIIINFLYC